VSEDIEFSILTPTWNRANYLQRVYDGLAAQTLISFEWIVADDGSKDDTEFVVKRLAEKSRFPIIYIRADRHVGKIRMDNAAVRQARGRFILWCDSDDWLLPDALKRLWETWNSIPDDRREEYVGITALAATDSGAIANPFPDVVFKDVSWNDLAEVHFVTTDMLYCARADALKAHPFPEVDMVIPESVVWTVLGHRLARLVPKVLKIVEYEVNHAISFSGIMSYNRGRAHALAATESILKSYRRSPKVRAWRLITYIRYCLHGDVTLGQAKKLWGSNSNHLSFYFAFPFALALAFRDRLQGKVKKTHLEFLESQSIGRFTTEILGASK
jgi:glycosyltransferase involved in cell wall biosynthesis